MKRLATAVATAALLAAPAFAQVKDSESLTYVLGGTIPSQCELTPEGTTNVTVDMGSSSNQGLAAIGYACNSPFELTITSKNGGMKHGIANIVIDYDVDTYGFLNTGSGNGSNTFRASVIKANPGMVAKDTDWSSLNGGVQLGSLDLRLPGLLSGQRNVAGTYSDDLTVKLAAVW